MRQVEIKAKLGSIDEAQKLFTHNSGTWDALPIELHYLRAVTLLYAGRSEDARKTLITCMQLDPDNVKVKNLLKKAKQIEVLKEKGNEALKEKQYEQCIPIFTDALQIDPCNKKINALCYSNRGLAKLRLKNYKGAVEDLNKAIDFDDKYFKSYMRRAEARQELGDFDLAVGDYNEAGKFGGDTNETKRLIKDCQKKAKQAKRKDYYSILGVPKDADDKTIKKAYKKLAVQWHPDKHIEQADKEEAQKKFKDIGESYSVLMDPKKRQVFDDGGDPEGPGGMDGGSGGMDPSAMF
jgi:DnaJ family protein C protein 7